MLFRSLKGNNLENEGAEEILKAVQVAKNLAKLDLADNKIKELGKDGIVVKQIAAAVTFENATAIWQRFQLPRSSDTN